MNKVNKTVKQKSMLFYKNTSASENNLDAISDLGKILYLLSSQSTNIIPKEVHILQKKILLCLFYKFPLLKYLMNITAFKV